MDTHWNRLSCLFARTQILPVAGFFYNYEMTKVERYKCDHCPKVLTKSSMVRHEPKCFKNPKSRSCITCAHFDNDIENRRCLKTYKRLPAGKLQTNCPLYLHESYLLPPTTQTEDSL